MFESHARFARDGEFAVKTRANFRGAHAPRMLAIAPSRVRTSDLEKISAEAPKSVREARALPGESGSRR